MLERAAKEALRPTRAALRDSKYRPKHATAPEKRMVSAPGIIPPAATCKKDKLMLELVKATYRMRHRQHAYYDASGVRSHIEREGFTCAQNGV